MPTKAGNANSSKTPSRHDQVDCLDQPVLPAMTGSQSRVSRKLVAESHVGNRRAVVFRYAAVDKLLDLFFVLMM